jgi:hypothetical protein
MSIVQRMVAWLVARPQNAVLALAGTLLLPLLQLLSGVILVVLVLKQGTRVATIEAVVAGGLLSVMALVVQASVPEVVVAVLTTWVPMLLLASLLKVTRSLTLTMQVFVIVAVMIVIGFHVVVSDPLAFWQQTLTTMAEVSRGMGLQQQADILMSEQASVAGQMTMLVVFSTWSLYAVIFLLGYLLFTQSPGEVKSFGQFRNLNFGRVIAITMASVSMLALATDAIGLQNIAFLLFAVFWLQGLAVVHWLHAKGHVPAFGVIAVYAMMPILHVMLLMALAVLGYTDAWFRYRRAKGEQEK